jgi:hypothetical protein
MPSFGFEDINIGSTDMSGTLQRIMQRRLFGGQILWRRRVEVNEILRSGDVVPYLIPSFYPLMVKKTLSSRYSTRSPVCTQRNASYYTLPVPELRHKQKPIPDRGALSSANTKSSKLGR